MKTIETKTLQVSKNVVKTIFVQQNSTIEENINNQKKLRIRNKIQNITDDGLDLYDLIADLSNAFYDLLEQVKPEDTLSIIKFKKRYDKINEIIKNK